VASRTITVKCKEKSMDFHIFGDTKIKTDSGDNVPITELKNGTRVTVNYYKMGNLNHPLSINTKPTSKGTGKKQKVGKK
jgi:hypothetical protein